MRASSTLGYGVPQETQERLQRPRSARTFGPPGCVFPDVSCNRTDLTSPTSRRQNLCSASNFCLPRSREGAWPSNPSVDCGDRGQPLNSGSCFSRVRKESNERLEWHHRHSRTLIVLFGSRHSDSFHVSLGIIMSQVHPWADHQDRNINTSCCWYL